MYRALESFTTKNYDVKRKQILEEDFTNQDEINEFLNIGYIEVFDGVLDITENGLYDVKEYDNADVNVQGGGGGALPVVENEKLIFTTGSGASVNREELII